MGLEHYIMRMMHNLDLVLPSLWCKHVFTLAWIKRSAVRQVACAWRRCMLASFSLH